MGCPSCLTRDIVVPIQILHNLVQSWEGGGGPLACTKLGHCDLESQICGSFDYIVPQIRRPEVLLLRNFPYNELYMKGTLVAYILIIVVFNSQFLTAGGMLLVLY